MVENWVAQINSWSPKLFWLIFKMKIFVLFLNYQHKICMFSIWSCSHLAGLGSYVERLWWSCWIARPRNGPHLATGRPLIHSTQHCKMLSEPASTKSAGSLFHSGIVWSSVVALFSLNLCQWVRQARPSAFSMPGSSGVTQCTRKTFTGLFFFRKKCIFSGTPGRNWKIAISSNFFR